MIVDVFPNQLMLQEVVGRGCRRLHVFAFSAPPAFAFSTESVATHINYNTLQTFSCMRKWTLIVAEPVF
jgi:hypothetical protein